RALRARALQRRDPLLARRVARRRVLRPRRRVALDDHLPAGHRRHQRGAPAHRRRARPRRVRADPRLSVIARCAEAAAAWHSAWLTALGLRSERDDRVWRALDPPPFIYWTAISLAASATA